MVTVSAVVNSGLATDHGLAVCFGSTAGERAVILTAGERAVGLTVTLEVPRGVAAASVSERRNLS